MCIYVHACVFIYGCIHKSAPIFALIYMNIHVHLGICIFIYVEIFVCGSLNLPRSIFQESVYQSCSS